MQKMNGIHKLLPFYRKKPEKTEVWLNERDLLLSTETDHPTLKIKVGRFLPHPGLFSHFFANKFCQSFL